MKGEADLGSSLRNDVLDDTRENISGRENSWTELRRHLHKKLKGIQYGILRQESLKKNLERKPGNRSCSILQVM